MRSSLFLTMFSVCFIALQCTADGDSGQQSDRLLPAVDTEATVVVADVPVPDDGATVDALVPVLSPPATAAPVVVVAGRDADATRIAQPGVIPQHGVAAEPGVAAPTSEAGAAGGGTDNEREEDKRQKESQGGNIGRQNPTIGDNLPSSSTLPLSGQNKQGEKKAPSGEQTEKPAGDVTVLTGGQSKNVKTNNNKDGTNNQGNRKHPTDPKTVTDLTTNKSVTTPPKVNPVISTGTENKINLTTTTTMAEDVQPKSDANETSKTPTTTLAKQTKTLEQLQTLDTKDGSSSTPLIFAFATLVTLALVSVISVS